MCPSGATCFVQTAITENVNINIQGENDAFTIQVSEWVSYCCLTPTQPFMQLYNGNKNQMVHAVYPALSWLRLFRINRTYNFDETY
jgi:hypothetical protein